jgi:hypothetical protein
MAPERPLTWTKEGASDISHRAARRMGRSPALNQSVFESEEPHARKPRNETALNPLKTNDPAKSSFAADNDFNDLRPAMRNPSFRSAKRFLSLSLFFASSTPETKRPTCLRGVDGGDDLAGAERVTRRRKEGAQLARHTIYLGLRRRVAASKGAPESGEARFHRCPLSRLSGSSFEALC